MEIKINWKEIEDSKFQNNIRCFRLKVGGKRFDIIGPKGTITLINKLSGRNGRKNKSLLMSVATRARNYLDTVTNPGIPYGFWTCECTKGFVRTNFTSQCPKCLCTINKHTNRATYLEDINFGK